MIRALRIENLALIRSAELEFAPGLNVVTGETGAGKTIFAQAIGLLLGAGADAGFVGPAGADAYVEAELTVPEGFWDEDDVAALSEHRPPDEPELVVARRVFADGRTRAYAWGRAVAKEDMAAAVELLVAMSGQFEQRRLSRAAYQLDVLDGYCGPTQLERRRAARVAWRELAAARRAREQLEVGAQASAARLAELEALVADTAGMEEADEDELRAERERLRRFTEITEAAASAAAAVAPDEGEGAATLAAAAADAIEPLAPVAPDLAAIAAELREAAVTLREAGGELHRFLASLEADPARVEHVEERLQAIADAKRRHGHAEYADLLGARDAARVELEAAAVGRDPLQVALDEEQAASERLEALVGELHRARESAASPFAEAVAAELHGIGMGEGEFRVELRERPVGPGGDLEAAFLARPNAGLAFAPVAETASGGELSRIALAIAVVGGGETLVFDEIDAGIGGQTAHLVAATLARLSERAQVIAITHLPQIASVAGCHLRVEKIPDDPTHTRIEVLEGDSRQAELERMLGGREFVDTLTSP